MTKFIQCVHTSNINNSPEETIYAIKNAGFDGVFIQWFNKNLKFSQENQLELARELGLEVPLFHLGYEQIDSIWLKGDAGDNLVEYYINDLNMMSKYNIPIAIMHLTHFTPPPKPTALGIKRLKRIISYAKKLNIKIAFENIDHPGYLEYVFERISSSNMGICFDAGHWHCFLNDYLAWDMFKDKIFCVHLHDNNGKEDQHLLPFDGSVNWKEAYKRLKEAGYNGDIILESLYSKHYEKLSLDAFYKKSFKRAKKIAKKLN